MQFKFNANQEFQLRAIQAVTGLLEGQPRVVDEVVDAVHELRLLRLHEAGFAAIPNRLDLDALRPSLRPIRQ